MADPAPNLSTLWGRTLADELARQGVRVVAVAPGARSAPLAFAVAAHPDLEDLSFLDERSAAFFALGSALATGWPAAVVTTSGTAAGNLLPAVLEADRAGVPLLVLTADRPAELRDAGDSQAGDQLKLFGHAVRWFHEVAPARVESLGYLRSTVAHALACARGCAGGPGPVHLNLPFSKPLEPVAGAGAPLPAGLGEGRVGGAPWVRVSAPARAPTAETVTALALALASARCPLVLAGALLDGRACREPIRRLSEVLAVPVFAEAASGVRLDPQRAPTVLGAADLFLGSARLQVDLAREPPDVVLRLGAAPLDWPLRQLAASWAERPEVTQIELTATGHRADPDHAVAWRIVGDPATTLAAVARWLLDHQPPLAADPAWAARFTLSESAGTSALARELARIDEPFDGRVAAELAELLPEDAALVVSASLPLRDVETFLPRAQEDVDFFANRGLNGIDGVTSTALGIAHGRQVPGQGSRTLLLTGDVAFCHDLSGALAAVRLGLDVTVVVVDNQGGAIFDHLPAANTEIGASAAFARHFTTTPGADPAEIARALGWAVTAPASVAELREVIPRALAASGPQLVVWHTERERSKALRGQLLQAVATAVDEALAGFAAPPLPPAPPPPPPSERPAPLVMLHGFTGQAASLADLAARLAPAVETLCFDLPGHGEAPAPPELTFAQAVAGVLTELDRRGLGRVHLLGYSLGGRVALAVAATAPERVASLTLIGASPGIPDDAPADRDARRASDEELAQTLESAGLAAFVDRWMAHPLFVTQQTLPHRQRRETRQARLGNNARGLATALRRLSRGVQPSYWDALGTLPFPVLLLVGEQDPAHTTFAREMAARLPHAKLVVFPGLSHAPHVEDVDAVAGWVRGFLGAC